MRNISVDLSMLRRSSLIWLPAIMGFVTSAFAVPASQQQATCKWVQENESSVDEAHNTTSCGGSPCSSYVTKAMNWTICTSNGDGEKQAKTKKNYTNWFYTCIDGVCTYSGASLSMNFEWVCTVEECPGT